MNLNIQWDSSTDIQYINILGTDTTDPAPGSSPPPGSYTLEYEDHNGVWQPIVSTSRKRIDGAVNSAAINLQYIVHEFTPVAARKIRLTVSTGGSSLPVEITEMEIFNK